MATKRSGKGTRFVKIKRVRSRRNAVSLDISHEDIDKAVEEFLGRGGKITKLEPVRTFEEIMANGDPNENLADDFLNGN